MRSLTPNVRHIFTHETFDGLSLNSAQPQIINPKDILSEDFNQHRYHTYVSSLQRNFPDYFPKIETTTAGSSQEAQKCRDLLQGLKCVEVVFI